MRHRTRPWGGAGFQTSCYKTGSHRPRNGYLGRLTNSMLSSPTYRLRKSSNALSLSGWKLGRLLTVVQPWIGEVETDQRVLVCTAEAHVVQLGDSFVQPVVSLDELHSLDCPYVL